MKHKFVKNTICFCCQSINMEILQNNQIACKDCRTLFVASDITEEEMIEWFCI